MNYNVSANMLTTTSPTKIKYRVRFKAIRGWNNYVVIVCYLTGKIILILIDKKTIKDKSPPLFVIGGFDLFLTYVWEAVYRVCVFVSRICVTPYTCFVFLLIVFCI